MITRSTVGLEFRDQFTRANNALVGNGWDESIIGDGTLRILGNEVEKPVGGFGTFGTAYRDGGTQEALVPDLILQLNGRWSGNFNLFINIRTDLKDVGAGFEDRYSTHLARTSSAHRFDRVINGAVTDTISNAFAPANVSRGMRIITEVDGGDLIIRGKITDPLVDIQDLSEKYDADSWQFTDTSPIPLAGATLDYYFLAQNGSANEMDEFMFGGRNVVVNDVPSGWKVVLDGGTPFVSTGVPLVIDVDEEALPFSLLEITNDLDVVQDSISPSPEPGYGGDVYEAGFAAGAFDPRASTADVDTPVVAGDPVNIVVQGRDSNGVPVTAGGATVEILVEGLSLEDPLDLVVTDVGDGTYTASYVTTEQDTQTVTIKAAASPLESISGSPFTVEVTPTGEAIVFGSGSANPVWKDRALLGFFIGRPDKTDIQEITGSLVGPPGQVFVADNSLYFVGEDLQLFRDALGKDLPYLEDPDEIFDEGDRMPAILDEPDLPPASNIAPNPGMNEFSSGQPDDILSLGTVVLTQTLVGTDPQFVEIGGQSLRVEAFTQEAGVESIPVTITPVPAENPYFAAWAKLWIVAGSIRFELVHSVLGVIPSPDSNERAVVTQTDAWVTVYIVPGENLPFVDGTLSLRIVAEGSAAEWYLDAWVLSNTPFALPWISGNPGNVLYDRVVQRFLNEAAEQPKLRYGVSILDLSDSVFPEDFIRLGNPITVKDGNINVDTVERTIRERRDLFRQQLVGVELADRRLALTAVQLQRLARLEPVRRLELVPTLILFLPFFDEFGELIVQYSGNHRTQSVRFVLSTDSAPTREQVLVGTVNAGRADDRVSTGLFTDADVFVGMIPFSEPAGLGTAGPLYAWTGRNAPAVANSPRLDNVMVVIVQADGDVTVTFDSGDAGTLSTRHAFNVGTAPVYPSTAAVEAGTIRNFAFPGSDVFSLGAATVPKGETIRLSAAPYSLAGGVGGGGATDHGTIVSGEDQREAADPQILTFISAEDTAGSGPGCGDPWIEELSWTLQDAPDVDFDVQIFRKLDIDTEGEGEFQLVTTISDPNTTTSFLDDPTGSFKATPADPEVLVTWRLDLRDTTGSPVVVHQLFTDETANVDFTCLNS